jgi:hypothetical protein
MIDFISIYKDLLIRFPFPPEKKSDRDELTVEKINAAFKQIEEHVKLFTFPAPEDVKVGVSYGSGFGATLKISKELLDEVIESYKK